MSQPLVAFLAGLLGGGLGAAAAIRWMPPAAHTGVEVPTEGRGLDEVKEQLAELRRLLDRPGLAAAPAARPRAAAGGPETGTPASAGGAEGTAASLSRAELSALIENATASALERQSEAEKAVAAKLAPEERKRVPLAQAARDLGLSAAQETDVRRAYAEAVDGFLKLIAEPESDAETLRRELMAAKDDPEKKTEFTMKMMPKLFTKLGDVMKLEATRKTKINAAVGPEMAKKLSGMKLEEEDPFGLDSNVTVSASSSDGR